MQYDLSLCSIFINIYMDAGLLCVRERKNIIDDISSAKSLISL